MIGALKQLEAGRKAEDLAREVGVSKDTIYAWKAKYRGMYVSQAQEAKLQSSAPLCAWANRIPLCSVSTAVWMPIPIGSSSRSSSSP